MAMEEPRAVQAAFSLAEGPRWPCAGRPTRQAPGACNQINALPIPAWSVVSLRWWGGGGGWGGWVDGEMGDFPPQQVWGLLTHPNLDVF
jgi:hypothetical protein